MSESTRLLRHIPSGVLYVYQPAFANRPDFEEVIDVESRVIEEPAPKPRKKRESAPVEAAPADSIDAALDNALAD